MDNPTTKEIGGIRLHRLNAIMITITILLGVALMLVTLYTQRSFYNVEEATKRYILARRNAGDMQAGSDYLTDRVRTFIVTGDRACVEDFFREIEVTKRRDHAIENMEQLVSDNETARHLNEALRLSNELTEIERYAMRLAVEANGYDITTFPDALQKVRLTEADLALSHTEQAQKAQESVFDKTYQTYKAEIRANVQQCEQLLADVTERLQKESEDQMQAVLTVQSVLLVLVVLVVLAIVICVQQMIIRPIETVVDAISAERIVPLRGAYELRFLAKAYNDVFAQTKKHQDRLAYEASHDQLTGLYNRGVFEKVREKNGRRAQTMLLIDVDKFKTFNDTYGHAVGDQVLQKVSSALQSNFRSEDYVCRIGGDEFAVLMLHTNASMRGLIENKIQRVTERLADTSDGLPIVTLSIGVAFLDSDHKTKDLYKDADAALYTVKGSGCNGFAFYDDTVNHPEEKEQEDLGVC